VLLFFKLRYNATGDGAWMRAYFFMGEGVRAVVRASASCRA
jgi:hypothetical protein